MKKKTTIRAVEMVRKIRDELQSETGAKSRADLIAFYRAAGDTATQEAANASVRAAEEPTPKRRAQG